MGAKEVKRISWLIVDILITSGSFFLFLVGLLLFILRIAFKKIGTRTQIILVSSISQLFFGCSGLIGIIFYDNYSSGINWFAPIVLKASGFSMLLNVILLVIFMWIGLYYYKSNIYSRKKNERHVLCWKVVTLCELNFTFIVFSVILFCIPIHDRSFVSWCYSGYFLFFSVLFSIGSLFGLVLVKKLSDNSLIQQRKKKTLFKVSFLTLFVSGYNLTMSILNVLYPISHYFMKSFALHGPVLNVITIITIWAFVLLLYFHFGYDKRKKRKDKNNLTKKEQQQERIDPFREIVDEITDDDLHINKSDSVYYGIGNHNAEEQGLLQSNDVANDNYSFENIIE